MKNSMKIWFAKLPDLSAVIARFPVATVVMAIFTIVIILDHNSLDEKTLRLLAGLAISAYVSFCVVIPREAGGQSNLIWLQALLVIPICVLAIYSETLHINLVMALAAILLILGNIVLWRKTRNDLHVWDFTHKIWTGAVFATVGSIVFTFGILAITFALKSLFGLSVDDLMTDYILPIGLGFLAPLYWLSTVPKTDESYEELYNNPGFVSKAVAFLGTWLLSPLTLIYALILLAYAVKIAVTATLPKGEIASLTTPFLIVGTLTWLILEPPFIRNKLLAKLFRKSWFFLSMPAAILLAVSVFVRVYEYGLTPERYALILAVIWALGVGIWFIFGPQSKRDIRLIPGFASFLFLFGAFSADGLSIQSQAHRLKVNLEPAGLLTEKGMLSGGPIVDMSSAQKVKGSAQYLLRRNGKEALKRTLKSFGYDDYPDTKTVYSALGVEDVKLTSRYNLYSNKHFKPSSQSYVLAGYDYAVGPLRNYFVSTSNLNKIYSSEDWLLSSEKFSLVVKKDMRELGRFDIENWLQSLDSKVGENQEFLFETDPLELFSDGDQTGYLKFHSIRQSQNDDVTTSLNIEFSILLKGSRP